MRTPRRQIKARPLGYDGEPAMYVLPLFMLVTVICGVLLAYAR